MIKELIKRHKKQKICNHKFVKVSVEYGLDYSGFEWKRERFVCKLCKKKKTEKYLIRVF